LKSSATGQRTGLLSLLRNKYGHLATTVTTTIETTSQQPTTVAESSILAKMRMKWKPKIILTIDRISKISTVPSSL
jgi:hypothetical protein